MAEYRMVKLQLTFVDDLKSTSGTSIQSSSHLQLHRFITRILCGVERRDKDRVATSPLGYIAVLSMWLQNENLEGLGAIAFQMCWLLWGVAKKIHPLENFWGCV